jgi:hypothetical protein
MTEQLELATKIAKTLGLPPTWPNLRTIEIALICETAFSSISLREAAELIVACAKNFRVVPKDYRMIRYLPINRFWFEDSIWRYTFDYATWKADRPDEVARRAAENRREEGIRAAIVGRCTGCQRPRFQSDKWIDFCCDGCREDYEGRVARRDRIVKEHRQLEATA